MFDERLSALVADIYAGGHEPKAWQRAIRTLIDLTDSQFSLTTIADLNVGEFDRAEMHGPDDARFLDAVQDYRSGFYRQDPMLQFAQRNPTVGITSLATAGPWSDYRECEYSRWSESNLRAGDCTVRYTRPINGLAFSLSLGAKIENGLHRDIDLKLLDLCFGHLHHAMRLAIRPPDLTSMREPRMLLGHRGHVVAMSPAAEAVVSAADGLVLTGGRLTAPCPKSASAIEALIHSAADARNTGGRGGVAMIPRPSGAPDRIVAISPMPYPPGPFTLLGPCVEVRIITLSPHHDNASHWRAMFSLTPAEARLADTLFASDCDLRNAAERCGVTYATARVHLANIFRKTRTNSQSQLIRLLTLVRER